MFTILEIYIPNIKNMNNTTNIDSLYSLEEVVSMIGDDMKNLYSGVRENWWKLRQLIIVKEKPQGLPSEIFSGDNGLSADDNFPFMVCTSSDNSIYVWNPENKTWDSFLRGNSLHEFSDNIITLSQNKTTYIQEIKKDCKLKFDLSNLDGDNKIYEFKTILKISSGKVSFDKNVVWDNDEIPSLDIGKFYIISVTVINNVILAKILFKSSKV